MGQIVFENSRRLQTGELQTLDCSYPVWSSPHSDVSAVIDPLPSYGRGRDTQGGRFSCLIFGTNLTDVVITGDNGTIDGQDNVQIFNLTLVNSPFWNVHPVDNRLKGISGDPFSGICISNVTIQLAKKAKKVPWTCTHIAGISSDGTLVPCDMLSD
ncbi:polygalacturonase protein [Spatholobus suberectus]|nr:polygalacturonase protein [Spatholobus suberectus]